MLIKALSNAQRLILLAFAQKHTAIIVKIYEIILDFQKTLDSIFLLW